MLVIESNQTKFNLELESSSEDTRSMPDAIVAFLTNLEDKNAIQSKCVFRTSHHQLQIVGATIVRYWYVLPMH